MVNRVEDFKLLNFASHIDENTIEQAKDTARMPFVHPLVEIPEMLVAQGFVAAENRDAVAVLLAQHQDGWAETEYDSYCQCGKWLEHGHYELEDHQSNVLYDSGLLKEDV